MSKRKYMTAAQRRRHYDDWLASGMTRAHCARLHGLHIKTFGNLCRNIAAEMAPATEAPLKTPLLPVTFTVSDSATLNLHRAGVTSTPAGIAAIIRELNLC